MPLTTAVLGGELTVTTFDGKARLKVKPRTQNNTRVKLTGKGFPVYREEGKFGDLYITYQVTLPGELNEEQRKLFESLRATNL